MKRITLTLLVSSLVLHVCAQPDTIPPSTLEVDYLTKGKNQTAGGGLLVVAGAIGLSATLISDVGRSMSGLFTTTLSFGTSTPERKSYVVPYLLSGGALVGGIVLLAEGSRNKRKAKAVQAYIDLEQSKVANKMGIETASFPVVGLKIQL